MENKEHLQEQIEGLSNLIGQVQNQITNDTDFKHLIIILDAIGKGATRLAILIRAQQALGDEKSFPDLLADAVKDLLPDSDGG